MENPTTKREFLVKLLYHEMANLRATLHARGYGNLHHLILPYNRSQEGSIIAYVNEDMGTPAVYNFTSFDECRDLIRTIEAFCLRGPMGPINDIPFIASSIHWTAFTQPTPRQPGYILQTTTAPGGTNGP